MNKYLVVTLIISIVILIRHFIVGLWMSIIGNPVFTCISPSIKNDVIVAVIFLMATLLILTTFCKNKNWYNIRKLAIVSCVITCFYGYVRVSPTYSDLLVHFRLGCLHNLCYGDVFAIEALLYLVLFGINGTRNSKKKMEDHAILSKGQIYDDSLPNEDLLNGSKDAKLLVDYILSSPINSGLGVSIQGAWGTGKTTFLHYIDNELKARGVTSVWFNPWIENVSDVKYCFLQRLRSLLKDDNKLEKLLREYENQIKVSNVTNWFSLTLLTLKQFINHTPSLFDLKKEIRGTLNKRRKTYVFFIDDCDRLDKDVFIDVVSLIRTIADLPNIIIIAAFDPKLAKVALRNKGGMDYLKKMFNVNHLLLPMSNGEIADYLTKEIQSQELPLDEKHNPFDQFSVRDYLPTLREAKHYLNQIIKDYQPYKNNKDFEVLNWYKWFILELLKFYDGYLYEQLKNTPTRILKQQMRLSWNWQHLEINDEFLKSLDKKHQKLLGLLFNTYSSSEHPFDISNIVYFQCYFTAKLPSRFMTIQEFSDNIEGNNFSDNSFLHYINEGASNLVNILEFRIKDEVNYYVIPVLVNYVSAKLKYHRGSTLASLQNNSIYLKISEIVNDEPWIFVAAMESFNQIAFDENDIDKEKIKSFDNYIKKSTSLEIIAAIFTGAMKHYSKERTSNIMYYFLDILKTEEARGNFADIVWMIADCPYSDLKGSFLDTFLDKHFFDVIPYLLSFVQNDGQVFIMAKSRAVRGLFDTFDNYMSLIKKRRETDNNDKEMRNEFTKLLFFTGVYSGGDPRTLKIESYPSMTKYKPERILNMSPINSQKIEKDFWNTKSRYKDEGDFYLEMDSNV